MSGTCWKPASSLGIELEAAAAFKPARYLLALTADICRCLPVRHIMPLPPPFKAKVQNAAGARHRRGKGGLFSDGPVGDWNANLNCDTSPPNSTEIHKEMSNHRHHFNRSTRKPEPERRDSQESSPTNTRRPEPLSAWALALDWAPQSFRWFVVLMSCLARCSPLTAIS